MRLFKLNGKYVVAENMIEAIKLYEDKFSGLESAEQVSSYVLIEERP